jgi:hypothetical protein
MAQVSVAEYLFFTTHERRVADLSKLKSESALADIRTLRDNATTKIAHIKAAQAGESPVSAILLPEPATKRARKGRRIESSAARGVAHVRRVKKRADDDEIAALEQEVVRLDALARDLKNDNATISYMLDFLPFENRMLVVRGRYKFEIAQPGADHERAFLEYDQNSKEIYSDMIKKLHPELAAKSSHYSNGDVCPKCAKPMQLHKKAMFVCAECGISVVKQTTQVPQSYADMQNASVVRTYNYQRINHFRALLRQVQGNVSDSITDTLRAKVATAIGVFGVDCGTLTPERMRRLLKRINENHAYKLMYALCDEFNPNYTPCVIEEEHAKRLIAQFVEAELPFEKWKNAAGFTRAHFLNYPYVARRLCDMNGYPYSYIFRRLKQPDLIERQDRIWRRVCMTLNWPFENEEGSVSLAVDFSDKTVERPQQRKLHARASSSLRETLFPALVAEERRRRRRTANGGKGGSSSVGDDGGGYDDDNGDVADDEAAGDYGDCDDD